MDALLISLYYLAPYLFTFQIIAPSYLKQNLPCSVPRQFADKYFTSTTPVDIFSIDGQRFDGRFQRRMYKNREVVELFGATIAMKQLGIGGGDTCLFQLIGPTSFRISKVDGGISDDNDGNDDETNDGYEDALMESENEDIDIGGGRYAGASSGGAGGASKGRGKRRGPKPKKKKLQRTQEEEQGPAEFGIGTKILMVRIYYIIEQYYHSNLFSCLNSCRALLLLYFVKGPPAFPWTFCPVVKLVSNAEGDFAEVRVEVESTESRRGREPVVERVPLDEAKHRAEAAHPGALRGAEVRKMFEGELFDGRVDLYEEDQGWYRVVYQDGDFEEMDPEEILTVLKKR